MRRYRRRKFDSRDVVVAAAMTMLFALSSAVFAQTTAQLSGLVVDESGGALPGVEVTVTQTSTGATRFVITGAQGDYVFHESSGRPL